VASARVWGNPTAEALDLVQRARAPLAASVHPGPSARAAAVAGGGVLAGVLALWLLGHLARAHLVQPVGRARGRFLGLLGGALDDSWLGTPAQRKYECAPCTCPRTEFDGGILLSICESPRLPSTPYLLLTALCSLLLLSLCLRSAPHLYVFRLFFVSCSGAALEVVAADSRSAFAVGQAAARVGPCDVGSFRLRHVAPFSR